MAETRRTQKEIEDDCKKIKEAAKTATSIKELEKATNLSYGEINTTLSKHPIIYKRIREQIAINKKNAIKCEELKKKNELKEAKKEKLQQKEELQEDKSKDIKEGFVIDASIAGVETLREDIAKICSTKLKIILTSITIKELDNMQKYADVQGNDARYILAIAAENYDNFETVLINENYDTPDACIVQYCAENSKQVTLLTADKRMALEARMHNVKVQYMKKKPEDNNNHNSLESNSKIRTLFTVRRINNRLYISLIQNSTKAMAVYSNGVEYNEGEAELKIGDDVFIACKRSEYITFAHYKIILLYTENNCELIYSKRIYDYEEIDISNASYKSFLKNFKHRLNL